MPAGSPGGVIPLGELALWIALLMAVWGALASYAGGALRRRELITSGARALEAAFAFVALASVGLWAALLESEFSLRYVALHTTANLPLLYKLSAFWAGLEGTMLLWCLTLASVAVIVLRLEARRDREGAAYVAATLATALTLLLVAASVGANPYARLGWLAPEGRGLNPLLQHPAMTLRAPALYLGYAAATVPFAFTVGASLSRRFDATSLPAVRRWTLVSWWFLTAGIATGLWWAYTEPALAGRWARAPIENASLFPWLSGTALAHTLLRDAKHSTLRSRSIALVAATFVLSVLGALVSLGGTAATLGSFVRSPAGLWFAVFGGAVVALVLTGARVQGVTTGVTTGSVVAPASRRRFGGHLAHAGTALLAVGLTGVAFGAEHEFTVAPGGSFTAVDPHGEEWTFTSQGISQYPELNRQVTALVLEATREGAGPALVRTEQRQYVDIRGAPTFDPSIEAGILGSMREDVYVVLEHARRDEHAAVRVAFHPLARLVWLGAALMLVGGVIVIWPQRAP